MHSQHVFSGKSMVKNNNTKQRNLPESIDYDAELEFWEGHYNKICLICQVDANEANIEWRNNVNERIIRLKSARDLVKSGYVPQKEKVKFGN